MEKQGIHDHGETVDEEFPDEFQCCVCLDIMYKPVVLVCGHISCFWCVLKAMDSLQESHCPLCRNPYNHFPSVCGLLHFLLLKLYPQVCKRRASQVAAEEEKRNGICGHEYHHFGCNFVDSQSSKITDVQGISSPQRTSHEHDKTTVPPSSSQTTCNQANTLVEHTNKVLVTDLLCAVCKRLLCHPVVLNCGHVYCESCIDPHPQGNICKCPVCQSAHPKGFPNVCLVLEHFLEEHFPEEYSARKASLPQCLGPPGKKQEEAAQSSYVPTDVYSYLFSGNRAKIHRGVGCDYCGVYPIMGLRYRCKDCLEKIGFDLCEDCYNSSSNFCGRFNQQHTREHEFEVMQPPNLQNTISRLIDELSEGSDEEMGGYTPVYFSDNGVVITASPESSVEDPCDLDDSTAVPDSSNERSEER